MDESSRPNHPGLGMKTPRPDRPELGVKTRREILYRLVTNIIFPVRFLNFLEPIKNGTRTIYLVF